MAPLLHAGWDLFGHPVHPMAVGFPLAFGVLALLMSTLLPAAGPVVRWTVRWTALAAVGAVVTGVAAAGGPGEALAEARSDPTLARHALLALAATAAVLGAAWAGKGAEGKLSRLERAGVAGFALLVVVASWLGGDHVLAEERDERAEPSVALPAPGPADDGEAHDHADHDH